MFTFVLITNLRDEQRHSNADILRMYLEQHEVSASEYRIRERMARDTEPLILPGKRKSFGPTGLSVREMFEGSIQVGSSNREVARNLRRKDFSLH